MPETMNAQQILDREFLELRAKILELAASFDRLDRASGAVEDDPRYRQLQQALQALSPGQRDRAKQVQLLFSRDYQEDWRKQFGI